MKKPKHFSWQKIVKELSAKITNGDFKKGDRFYTIDEISKKYSVSNTTSRRVLLELSQEDLIDKIQGKGCFIKNLLTNQKIYFIMPGGEKISPLQYNSIIFAEVYRGILEQVNRKKIEMNISPSLFIDGGTSKLILAVDDPINQELYDLIRKNNFLCVTAHACQSIEGISTVQCDYTKGAYLAVSHLLSRGHHRIGFINNNINNKWQAPRFDGYYKALKENNIDLDLKLIKEVNDADPEEPINALKQLLSISNPATAIFAGNDTRALRILKYCKDAGIRVPEDLAVVGFDNIHESSIPGQLLTTVDTLWRKQGEEAVDLLLELSHEDSPTVKDIIVEPKLIIRESS